MTHVLFVEDDADTTSLLRSTLIEKHPDWDVRFVRSGEDALELMEHRTFDVVVTQAVLHGITGAELLSIVRYQSPTTTRMVMADLAQSSALSAGASVAHRVLLNPVNVHTIAEVIQRTSGLQTTLQDPELQAMISSIDILPRPSEVVRSLNELLDLPGVSALQAARTIERDPAMTAKLLSVINSAYYGLSHHVTEVSEAVAYLGLDVVRNLCVSNELMRSLEGNSPLTQSAVQLLTEHAVAVAHVARELLPDRHSASNAYAAALLCDVGLLVFAANAPEKLLELQVQVMRSNLPLTEVEMEVFGVHHAHVSAALLELWGLPEPIVEAVASHHDAHMLPGETMNLAHAVYIAERIVTARHQVLEDVEWNHEDLLEDDYLARIGASDLVTRMGMASELS